MEQEGQFDGGKVFEPTVPYKIAYPNVLGEHCHVEGGTWKSLVVTVDDKTYVAIPLGGEEPRGQEITDEELVAKVLKEANDTPVPKVRSTPPW
jgi:hypothetical protein